MRYVSRRYLEEKWDNLKWDMENFLDVYCKETNEDKVDEETLKRCTYDIVDMCTCIINELSKGD